MNEQNEIRDAEKWQAISKQTALIEVIRKIYSDLPTAQNNLLALDNVVLRGVSEGFLSVDEELAEIQQGINLIHTLLSSVNESRVTLGAIFGKDEE